MQLVRFADFFTETKIPAFLFGFYCSRSRACFLCRCRCRRSRRRRHRCCYCGCFVPPTNSFVSHAHMILSSARLSFFLIIRYPNLLFFHFYRNICLAFFDDHHCLLFFLPFIILHTRCVHWCKDCVPMDLLYLHTCCWASQPAIHLRDNRDYVVSVDILVIIFHIWMPLHRAVHHLYPDKQNWNKTIHSICMFQLSTAS